MIILELMLQTNGSTIRICLVHLTVWPFTTTSLKRSVRYQNNLVGDDRPPEVVTFIKQYHFFNTELWTQVISASYYAAFAWSLLDSVADTHSSPPRLRPLREVECIVTLNNDVVSNLSSIIAFMLVQERASLNTHVNRAAGNFRSLSGQD